MDEKQSRRLENDIQTTYNLLAQEMRQDFKLINDSIWSIFCWMVLYQTVGFVVIIAALTHGFGWY